MKLTYAPVGAVWDVSASVRFGKTNATNKLAKQKKDPVSCRGGAPFEFLCDPSYQDGRYLVQSTDYVNSNVHNNEEHMIVDFLIGRDFNFGTVAKSHISAGLRYAQLESRTEVDTVASDWRLPLEWVVRDYSQHDRYHGVLAAERQFDGAGPTLSWDAAKRLWGAEDAGEVDLDWSVAGSILFGKQKAALEGVEEGEFFEDKYAATWPFLDHTTKVEVDRRRSESVVVPNLALSLGLSYEVDRFKVSGGYRWERYFDAIDGGADERKTYDRAIDGPYFKIAVGFGG